MIRLPWRRAAMPAKPDGAAAESRTPSSDSVRGERGLPLGRGARSLQARMSSLLAAGLMTSVGAGMLVWYYAEALSHPAAAHRRAQAPAPEAPGEGVVLPAFRSLAPSRAGAQPVLQPAAAPSAAALPASSLLEPPLAPAPGERPRDHGAPAQLSPRQQALERRLSGEVLAPAPRGSTADLASGDVTDARDAGAAVDAARVDGVTDGGTPSSAAGGDALEALLRPSVLAATQAQVLPDQRLLLPKGTFIDCTLETAIDST